MDYKELKSCLACGSSNIVPVHDLGLQPLVNNLKTKPEDIDIKFPIVVNECCMCTHRQLSIAVDPKLLFENYLYQTGTSEKHTDFFQDFVKSLSFEKHLMALDIGCNDGTLLLMLEAYNWHIMGIEPSRSFADYGLPIIRDFFPTKEPINKRFDLITAFNVFAHNDNPKLFLEEAAKLLNPNGRIYLLTTPARLDNYYHEHISYFTPQSMMVLASRCGLEVKSFKTTTMHGESYLFELAKIPYETVGQKTMRKWEENAQFDKFYRRNLPIVGYGASASGIVLMNYANKFPEYVVDDNPLKQGKFIPGVNVPIYSNEHLAKEDRDLGILILAHHLFDEIVAKIKALRPNKKDVFIHPYKGVL